MIVDNLLSQIDKGREGANWALSMGSPKLENYIDGLSLSTYFLLFSSSGVGKTSLALRNFIYEPIKDNINDLSVVEFHFISLEMKAEVLLAKLLSMYIFDSRVKPIKPFILTVLNLCVLKKSTAKLKSHKPLSANSNEGAGVMSA